MDARPMGGYFELELPPGRSPFPAGYPVNLGRAGLELIVRARGYTRVFVPEYICPVVFEKLKALGLECCVYTVDEKLEIDCPVPSLRTTDGLLYVNYFGMKNAYCDQLARSVKNLILDLAQAFFYTPPAHTDAFNSARKFVGVPDGGYVFGDFVTTLALPRAASWRQCEHLLCRLDGDVAGGYQIFKTNESSMRDWPSLRMSTATERMLHAANWESIRRQRIDNVQCLHGLLGGVNRFMIGGLGEQAPLCYPLLIPNGAAVKRELIARRIFVPTYWPNPELNVLLTPATQTFVANLVCLPIDQRYGVSEMSWLAAQYRKCMGEL